MRSKNLFITLAIIFSLTALYIFTPSKNKNKNKSSAVEDIIKPRVELEKFSYLRFDGNQLKGFLSAFNGYYLEPNLIKLTENVNAEELNKNQTVNKLRADEVLITLHSNSIEEVIKSPQMDKAEATSNVELNYQESILKTKYVLYDFEKKLLSSSFPVRVQRGYSFFQGDKGFTYNLVDDTLKVMGQVDGELESKENRP